MNTVLLGATKGMGRALARRMAARGDRLFLLGRDATELAKAEADLRGRAGDAVVAGSALCDLADPTSFPVALNAAEVALGGIDTVVVTAAQFGSQDELESDSARLTALLSANFSHTLLFCEEARKRLLKRGGGTLCVFSSVAGDRGRKPVVLYGATKAGLSYYLEALDHKYHAAGLRVVTVKPGFVKTGMTAGLKPPPFAGEPDGVARDVLRAIDRGAPVVYTPAPWRLVMLVIRNLPRFVMRRIGF
jgi:short-subunit dehydrogenase